MGTNTSTDIWAQWNSRRYLSEYFKEIGEDVRLTTNFVTRALTPFEHIGVSRLLEFGSGPTIVGVIGAARIAQEIHVCDFLQQNLDEIELWKKNSTRAANFDNVISLTLELEGTKPTQQLIDRRAAQLRSKITKIAHCDAGKENPITGAHQQYPLVISLYCADSATDSKKTWRRYMKNILSLVAPSGTVVLAALRNSEYYRVGNDRFPSAHIDEKDLLQCLVENGFPKTNISLRVEKTDSGSAQGFSGLIFVTAQKAGYN